MNKQPESQPQNIQNQLKHRLNDFVIRETGRRPTETIFHAFFRFFIRLNRFYNTLYEKTKPDWMRKK